MSKNSASYDRRGVTIVAAILILAIVVIISFAIGTLAIREIRNSRLQTHSEPAITAASGGGESILFFRGRELADYNNPCPASTVTDIFGVSAPYNSSFEACTIYYGQEEITSVAGNEKSFLINNPIDTEDIEAGYSSLSIQITGASGATQFTVDAYDLDNPTACPLRNWWAASGTRTLSGLDTDTSYALFIYPCGPATAGNPPACGGSAVPSCGSGSITAILDGTANTAQGTFSGVPLENPIIESTGERQGQQRKLQIELDKTP